MSTAMVPPARSFLNGSTGRLLLAPRRSWTPSSTRSWPGSCVPGRAWWRRNWPSVLGVSKTPVREALKTLAGAGLVTMSPYRGATVRAIDPASAAAIYDLRLLLEPEAVGRAVGRGAAREARSGRRPSGRSWASALAALAASTPPATRRSAAWPTASSTAPCTSACGNALLVKTLDDLRDQTALVSARCPGSRPRRGSRRRPSTGPSWPRRGSGCGRPRRRPCSARTSPVSRPGISRCPSAPPRRLATEWSTDAALTPPSPRSSATSWPPWPPSRSPRSARTAAPTGTATRRLIGRLDRQRDHPGHPERQHRRVLHADGARRPGRHRVRDPRPSGGRAEVLVGVGHDLAHRDQLREPRPRGAGPA